MSNLRNQKKISRRQFIKKSAAGITVAGAGAEKLLAQVGGERPAKNDRVQVVNPLNRVPVSFIIDDSTCLVNMAYFGIPQFAEVFPERYQQNWKSLPREIPDSFVRKFGEWCHEHRVKGKYSIVPYPACVGWVDRYLPGWTKKQLQDSLKLVRELLLPDWDIHPEMVSHTIAIDTKTGRPFEKYLEENMENWGYSVGKSVDELTGYLSYALQILKNADLPCEGITTPGGFGSRVLAELSQATLESCRSVYQTEIPHYFRHLYTDDRSVAPRVENASGLNSSDPKCVVSIIGCTGDWFGGWDGLKSGDVDKFITADLKSGRMVEVIERGEPAIMVCHWPGIYYNGEEVGFKIFKEVVRRIHSKYDNLIWMKLSEIARYWASKELTTILQKKNEIVFSAPFSCPDFTIEVNSTVNSEIRIEKNNAKEIFQRIDSVKNIKAGEWCREGNKLLICFNLQKGKNKIILA